MIEYNKTIQEVLFYTDEDNKPVVKALLEQLYAIGMRDALIDISIANNPKLL